MARRALTIGFLIDRWDPARGGAERALAALARHLERGGHRVLAFARAGAAGAPGELRRVAAGGWTRSARERALARALAAAAAEARCDVTVGARHLERVDLYWPHDGAHRSSLEARRRMQGRDPSAPPRGRHRAFLELERDLLERGGARQVACVSRLVERELAAAYPSCRDRLVLVENGVDLERFHPRHRAAEGAAFRRALSIDPSTPLIAFAGRDARRKGLPQLLSALSTLERERWTLVVAGPSRPWSWRARVAAEGLAASRVRILEHADAQALFSAADLCVLPTWRDASGLVILEALACGTPVVTTAQAGASDAIQSPSTGTVLPSPADTGALAEAVSAWLERIRSGSLDRAVLHSSVLSRSEPLWLARLEALLLELGPRER